MAEIDEIMVTADAARAFCERALTTASVPAEDARLVAGSLVEADLRGVSSHGIQIVPRYVRALGLGTNPRPQIETVVDAGALALLDGDCGMGQLPAVMGMNMAIERAREHGIAAVGVRNSNHVGALAYYGMMAVDRDMIGICSVNGPALMAPWGGVTETMGNNPLCIAVPAGSAYPIVLDMAVSTAARNKVRVAAAEGRKIPTDWALDSKGRPTDDPNEALEGLLAPVGGAKGFGLAVAMEALTSVLSGGLIGKDVPREALASADVYYPTRVSHYFQAIDVGRLTPIGEFKSGVDELARQVHESELAEGTDAVYMPGEIEFITKERRLRDGIPIPPGSLSGLDRIAREISVEPLAR